MSGLSRLFRDVEIPAANRLVYWMEKVVRHGGASHLRTSAFDLNINQYNLFDVLAFLGLVLIDSVAIAIYAWVLFCRFVCRCCSDKRKRHKIE